MGITSTVAIWALLLATPEPVEFHFAQVAPTNEYEVPLRRADQTRAVVLIAGLRPHPFDNGGALKPYISYWEKPDSTLVKTLAEDSDVYALGYQQIRTVDDIATAPGLRRAVDALRRVGYTDVVLVGHSAGGLIARYYVENQPHGGGVSKVIQLCAPNTGSTWAKLAPGVRESQEAFIVSLSKEFRTANAKDRAEMDVPTDVAMACVVSNYFNGGDGVVRCDSQWPSDLQRQGVPAFAVSAPHPTAPATKAVAKVIAELVRDPLPRWTEDEVKAARAKIIGKEK